MRVLMVNYEFPPIGGGTGVACSQLLAEFANRPGIVIDLVTSGTIPQPTVERLASNIEIHRLPVAKRDLFYWRAGELFQWTRRAISHARMLSRQRQYDAVTAGQAGHQGSSATRCADAYPISCRCAVRMCQATAGGCVSWIRW